MTSSHHWCPALLIGTTNSLEAEPVGILHLPNADMLLGTRHNQATLLVRVYGNSQIPIMGMQRHPVAKEESASMLDAKKSSPKILQGM